MKAKVITGFLAGLLLTLGACQQKNEATTDSPQKVKVAQVAKIASAEEKSFSGIVSPAQEVNLAFRVGGPIQELYIKKGDVVKKGQLVARMDTRDYQIQYDVAKAQYEQVTSETKRVAELYKRNSVTEVDYQKAVAGEKMVKAQLDHAWDQLNDTKLYAPFNGIIQTINFEVGELVNTGMPIAVLLNTQTLEIAVDVPAPLFVKKDHFGSIYATVPSASVEQIPLKLAKYEPKANASQLYTLIFQTSANYPKNLEPGMEARITIVCGQVQSQDCYVPTRAIFQEVQQAYVWVFNSADSSVTKRAVGLDGIYHGEYTRINSGLQGNETIVVAGIHSLTESEKVAPIPAKSETNIGGLL